MGQFELDMERSARPVANLENIGPHDVIVPVSEGDDVLGDVLIAAAAVVQARRERGTARTAARDERLRSRRRRSVGGDVTGDLAGEALASPVGVEFGDRDDALAEGFEQRVAESVLVAKRRLEILESRERIRASRSEFDAAFAARDIEEAAVALELAEAVEARKRLVQVVGGADGVLGDTGGHLHGSSPAVGQGPVAAGPDGGAPGADTPGAGVPTVGVPTDIRLGHAVPGVEVGGAVPAGGVQPPVGVESRPRFADVEILEVVPGAIHARGATKPNHLRINGVSVAVPPNAPVTVHPLNAGNGLVEVTLTLIARSVVIAPASAELPDGCS